LLPLVGIIISVHACKSIPGKQGQFYQTCLIFSST